ncbi:uncharacterized protein LOC134357138 [Mobula hypostoma]|uniref:uncharacterized protein LOC134357138 n=1 Tax=Mobula hypostoma TaxID=723540 RepID=UPI002FC2DED5
MLNVGSKVDTGSDTEIVQPEPGASDSGDRTWSSPSSVSGAVGSTHVLNFKPVLLSSFTFLRNRMEALGVTYNSRSHRLVVLDSMGCVSWPLNPAGGGKRELEFPKQTYGVLKQIIHSSKFNVYFALGKDCSLKVYNKDFCETFAVPGSDLNAAKSIMFNPKADELITGGVGGVKFWKYRVNPKSTNKILPMSNYELFLRADYPHMGGTWVRKVELDVGGQMVLCCSVQALFCYNTKGQLLVVIPHPHKSSLTACISSPYDESLLTASEDHDVNQWTRKGAFVHRFTGHTRAVTNLVLHPETSSIFISGSKDGTIRLWSLDTLTQLLSLPVLEEGVEWLGLTEGSLLYCCSSRRAHIYSLSYFAHFWRCLGSRVTHLDTAWARQKTTRLSVLLEENSLHIMSQGQGLKLSQVLPLPTRTLLQYVYNRAKNLIFFLVDPAEIWIYSCKTNPACRVAVWNVLEILKTVQFLDVGRQSGRISVAEDMRLSPFDGSLWKVPLSGCCCIGTLSSPVYYATSEGMACGDSDQFLLLGLEDGRMLFVDADLDKVLYHVVQAHKGPLSLIKQSEEHRLICVGQETAGKCLKIWSLPKLDLLQEVLIPQSTASLSIIGSHLCLGLDSGSIIFHNVEAAESKLLPPFVTRLPEEACELGESRGTHLTGKVFTDGCPKQSIFLSCSEEEVLKIWDVQGYLLTEVILDHTLTYAIFLNNQADVLMGFKNHLFLIPHQKMLPDLTETTSVISSQAPESDIYEDPAVKYEDVRIDQQEIEVHLDMDSYLAPFQDRDSLLGVRKAGAASVICSSAEAGRTASTQLSMISDNQTATLTPEGSLVSSLQTVDQESTDSLQTKVDEKESELAVESDEPAQETTSEDLLWTVLPLSSSKSLLSSINESEVSAGEVPNMRILLQPPTTEVSTADSRASENLRKQLHISRAAVMINRLQPYAEPNLADSAEVIRRGLKVDRFLTTNKTLTQQQTAFQLSSELNQLLFLNIYKDKLLLQRKRGKRYKKGPKSKMSVPEHFQVTKKRAVDSDQTVSPVKSKDKEVRTVRPVKISVMDRLQSDLQRREAGALLRQERAVQSEERRLVHQLQRIQRQRGLPRHGNCIQSQRVQVTEPQVHVVQSEPPPLRGRLTGRISVPSSLSIPPIFPTPPAGRRPDNYSLPMDPRYRTFVVVRETYAPPEMPLPTPLEQRLLKERFPNYKVPLARQRPRLIDRKIYTPDHFGKCQR